MSNVATITPIHSIAPLFVSDGSEFREAHPHEIIARAEELIRQRCQPGLPVLDEPQRLAAYLRIHVGPQNHPVFGMIHLDASARLIDSEDLFHGPRDPIEVYHRDVLKSVLARHTAGVIFYQNFAVNWGGPRDPEIRVAQRLKNGLRMVDVEVRDYMIIEGPRTYSLAKYLL